MKIPKEKIYALQTYFTDIRYRKFYRSSDKGNLYIKGLNTLGTQVFMKNLYLFSEYLPKSMDRLQY